MTFRSVFVLSTLLTSAQLANAQFTLDGSIWLLEPSGTGQVGIDGVAGTEFDLEDDLGYGDDEAVPSASIWFGEQHQFGVSWLSFETDADARLVQAIRFEDLLFNIDSTVSSSLDATLIRGAYKWNLGEPDMRIGLIVGGQYLDVTSEVAATDIGRADADIQAGMPIAGAEALVQPAAWLQLRAGVVGFAWEFDNVDAVYIDARADAAVVLADHFFLGAGYRYIQIDAEDKDEPLDVDLTFSGPLVFGGVSW